MSLNFDSITITKIIFNGTEITDLIYNGQNVFSSKTLLAEYGIGDLWVFASTVGYFYLTEYDKTEKIYKNYSLNKYTNELKIIKSPGYYLYDAACRYNEVDDTTYCTVNGSISEQNPQLVKVTQGQMTVEDNIYQYLSKIKTSTSSDFQKILSACASAEKSQEATNFYIKDAYGDTLCFQTSLKYLYGQHTKQKNVVYEFYILLYSIKNKTFTLKHFTEETMNYSGLRNSTSYYWDGDIINGASYGYDTIYAFIKDNTYLLCTYGNWYTDSPESEGSFTASLKKLKENKYIYNNATTLLEDEDGSIYNVDLRENGVHPLYNEIGNNALCYIKNGHDYLTRDYTIVKSSDITNFSGCSFFSTTEKGDNYSANIKDKYITQVKL